MTLKLRAARQGKGWSLRDLELRTGIPFPTLSMIERGLVPAYPGWRRRLVRALQAPVEDLFTPEVEEDEQVVA